jgi:acetyl esterase/lipase
MTPTLPIASPWRRGLAFLASLLFWSGSVFATPAEKDSCSLSTPWPDGVVVGSGAGERYRDLRYWSGTTARLDVLLPAGWSGNAETTLLFIHGGGGYSGDKYEVPLREFFFEALRAGLPVVTVNYSLAAPGSVGSGGGDFSAGLRDVRAALAWIRRPTDTGTSGQDVGLPECVVVIGSSAGAQLASLIGTAWNADEGGRFDPGIPGANPRADLVVCVSGIFDLFALGTRGACPETKCHRPPFSGGFPDAGWCGTGGGFPAGYPGLSGAEWSRLPWGSQLPNGVWPPELWLGCEWGDHACAPPVPVPVPTNVLTGNTFADSSAIHWIDRSDTPFYLVHGVCDPITPFGQSEDFHAALRAAGVPSRLRSLDRSGHGIQPRGGGSNGVLSPAEAVIEVRTAIAFWNAQGGCSQAWTARYGCGVNPRGSIRVLDGHPSVGETVRLGLHNPVGTQTTGALPLLFVSTGAAPGFPCGDPLPGFGMSGAGELLIDLIAPALLSQVLTGSVWGGSASPAIVPVAFPADAALIGGRIFAQGLLVDPSGLGVRFAVTDAIEFRIGR